VPAARGQKDWGASHPLLQRSRKVPQWHPHPEMVGTFGPGLSDRYSLCKFSFLFFLGSMLPTRYVVHQLRKRGPFSPGHILCPSRATYYVLVGPILRMTLPPDKQKQKKSIRIRGGTSTASNSSPFLTLMMGGNISFRKSTCSVLSLLVTLVPL